jgi:hypothetical protein
MKNIVYLSPNFPTNYMNFILALKRNGANVLGLGDEPFQHLNIKIKTNLNEYYKVSDLHNYEELKRALGFFAYKYGKIDRLDSHNEYWLDTEARLRDAISIPGLKTNDIKKARSKSGMKKVFRELDMRVARGKLVHSLDEVNDFIKEVGFPVIVKPDSGVGAVDTYKINNEMELQEIFHKMPKVDCIMEEFITGQIHSFDGLADENSNPLFFTSHVFSQGIMETVNENSNMYYYSVKDVPAQLEEYGRKCLKAFGVKERFFHIEFFYTPNGEYIPLEVNLRPPGGLSMDMFNYACDIDLYQAWADMIVKSKYKLDYNRKYHVIYVGRKNGKSYVHGLKEILNKYKDLILLNQEMHSAFSPALGDYCFVGRSEKLECLQEMAHYIIKENS